MNRENDDLITCLWCQQSTPHETAVGACCWEGWKHEIDALRAELTRLREENRDIDALLPAGTAPVFTKVRVMVDGVAAQARRIAELEEEVLYRKTNFEQSCLWPSTIIESDQLMPDGRPCKLAVVPNWCIHKVECNHAKNLKSAIAAQDAALLAMREALEAISLMSCRCIDDGKPCAGCTKTGREAPIVAYRAFTSTAPAAQEAERRVLERAWERIKPVLKGIDQNCVENRGGWWETSTGAEFGAGVLKEITAILGTQRAVSEANTDQPTQPQG